MADSARGTKVVFVASGSPSDDNRAGASDVALRARLDEGIWEIVGSVPQDGLSSLLSTIAETSPGVVLVSLDGAPLAVPEIDELEIAVVEID